MSWEKYSGNKCFESHYLKLAWWTRMQSDAENERCIFHGCPVRKRHPEKTRSRLLPLHNKEPVTHTDPGSAGRLKPVMNYAHLQHYYTFAQDSDPLRHECFHQTCTNSIQTANINRTIIQMVHAWLVLSYNSVSIQICRCDWSHAPILELKITV